MVTAVLIEVVIPKKDVRAFEIWHLSLVGAFIQPSACDRVVDLLLRAWTQRFQPQIGYR